MAQHYSMLQAAYATGLEECEIRFFEQVFREFLTGTQPARDRIEFSQDHIDILRRIKRLLDEDGRSIDEVRRELRQALCASRADHGPALTLSPGATGQPEFPRRAHTIAVTSGRGGVGKTFLTVNLALAFAAAGQRVAIVDYDLELSSVQHLLGISPRSGMRPFNKEPLTLDDLVTRGPFGIRIISGAQGMREIGCLAAGTRRALLRDADQLEREVDILLIDTGSGISGDVLRLAAGADRALVVTTPHIAVAADSYSLIKIMLDVNPESRPGLVVNLAQNAYQGYNVYHRINTAIQKRLRVSLADLGSIVSDPHVTVACQLRKTLLTEYPHCEAFKCIRTLADTLLQHGDSALPENNESVFEDLMGALRRTVVGV